MAEDALARARAIAARLGAAASSETSELGKRKSRWDDPSGGDVSRPGLGSLKKKKVYIPVNEHPDINFLGLLIGPKGSTQKMLEEKSGAKILIRGRGSQKDGAPTGHPDDDDELHVCIEGTADAVEIATKEVERLLFNPEEALRLKREQLRNLAETRGGGGAGGGDGHYGPAGGSSGGGYHDDEETVELKVPNGMVGLIIGKSGENVQRMQAQCGVHVQIAKESEMRPGETHRTVILRGSADGVEEAKAQIEELIEERMHRGGRERKERDTRNDLAHLPFVLMIPIPNDKVGIVIGRSGATVRSIQDSTGTIIKVPPMPDENDPNTRTIAVGATSQQATEAAHAEIWRVIHSQAQQQYQQQMQQMQQQYRPPVEVPPVSYMTIPDDKVGVVIGKAGATIKDLQHRTGTRIQIPPAPDPGSYPPVRTISIQGSEQAAFLARCEIETLLGLPPAGMESSYGQYTAPDAQSSGEPGSYVNDPYADYFKDKTTVRGSHGSSQAAASQQQQQAQQQQQQQQYDPTAYYQQFWAYASYYGEAAARAYYGPWSPPVGTQPPQGVTVAPDPQQPSQQDQQQAAQQPAAPEGGASGTEASVPADSAAAGNSQLAEGAAAAAAAAGQAADPWTQYYQQQQQQQQGQPGAAGAAADSSAGQAAGASTMTPEQQEAWDQYYQQYYQYYGTAPPGYPAGYDQQYQQQYQQQGGEGAVAAAAPPASDAGADAQSAT